jgi:penicillin-binding protein 1A
MKPLTVYAPGFELGVINPGSVIEDLPFYYVNEQPFPRNSDRQYTYSTTVWKAVVSSVNAVAVNTLDIMGREYGFNFAKDKFGLSTLVKSYTNSNGQVFSDVEWAPLALGAPTVGVTVRDMTTAYATFANNGVYRDSRTYSLVYDNDGKLIIDNKQVSSKIVSDKTVEYMNYCLQGVVDYGTGTLASFDKYNVEVYGKTGSTTSNKDRWFCGFTSRYTAAVWCGYDNPEAITGVKPSGNPAVRLWKMVMEPLHKGYTDKPLVNMNNFTAVSVCMDCGKRSTAACNLDFRTQNYGISRVETVSVYPEDAPTEVCDCHILVDFCTTSNSVAHTGCTHTVKRALVKKTKAEVKALADASKVGLWSSHSSDGYIWLVDKAGADQPFYGVHGDKNVGITAPYIQCQAHRPLPVVPTVPAEQSATEP